MICLVSCISMAIKMKQHSSKNQHTCHRVYSFCFGRNKVKGPKEKKACFVRVGTEDIYRSIALISVMS